MRQIGTLPSETLAQRFADYLVTCSMEAHAELEGEDWAIWVRDEDHVADAQAKFDEFQQDPEAKRFQGVSESAEAIRFEEFRRREQARRNVVDMRTKWRGMGAAGSGPKPLTLTILVIAGLVFAFGGGVTEQFGSVTYSKLNFIDLSLLANGPPAAGPLASIKQGEVWRLITPIFMHFGVIHILFNSIWMWTFGGQIENVWSTMRLGVLVVVIAVISNLCMVLVPKDLGGHIGLAGGLSGVIYGLFGYLWMKSKFDRNSRVHMPDTTVILMIVWLFLCMSPWMQFMKVGNVAHVSGLITGMVLGFAPSLLEPSDKS